MTNIYYKKEAKILPQIHGGKETQTLSSIVRTSNFFHQNLSKLIQFIERIPTEEKHTRPKMTFENAGTVLMFKFCLTNGTAGYARKFSLVQQTKTQFSCNLQLIDCAELSVVKDFTTRKFAKQIVRPRTENL